MKRSGVGFIARKANGRQRGFGRAPCQALQRQPVQRSQSWRRMGGAQTGILIGLIVVGVIALQLLFLPPVAEHTGAESHLHAASDGVVRGGRVVMNLQHTSPSDLLVTLTHRPEGREPVTAVLANREHAHARFEQGFALPEVFVGRPIQGEWSIHLIDEAFSDDGRLSSFTLFFPRPCDTEREVCSDEAFTSEHAVAIEDLKFDWASPVFWASAFNFSVLVFLLVHFGRTPMRGFLTARRDQIQKDLTEARELHARAQKNFDDYANRLKTLDEELASIRSEMVRAGEEERARIVAEAEKKASRMRKESAFLIEQQLKQLRVDVTRETARAAVAEARVLLAKALQDHDQDRLARAYLGELERHAPKEPEKTARVAAPPAPGARVS